MPSTIGRLQPMGLLGPNKTTRGVSCMSLLAAFPPKRCPQRPQALRILLCCCSADQSFTKKRYISLMLLTRFVEVIAFAQCCSQLVIDKNKASVRFGLMHLLATNLCVWFVTAVTETAEDYRQQDYFASREWPSCSCWFSNPCFSLPILFLHQFVRDFSVDVSFSR